MSSSKPESLETSEVPLSRDDGAGLRLPFLLGPASVEMRLCATDVASLERLTPRVPDAWTLSFPDLSALTSSPSPTSRGARVCIACEDIAGPMRNGGIGTTYTALAKLLAGAGFDVTLLYLHGTYLDSGALDDWITRFADDGVAFVPCPDYATAEGFHVPRQSWLRQSYKVLRFLSDNAMDVAHVSEWRGAGYLGLLAKRQGLGLSRTLFVTKASSPWLWNRVYSGLPPIEAAEVSQMAGERASIERADIVVGGSAHLLRWMASQGYRLPKTRTFVQPNVVSVEHLTHLMGRRAIDPAQRRPVAEIVFFGRLEARKGLVPFCAAIDRLVRQGRTLPPITFLGKVGTPLPSRPQAGVLDAIADMTRSWPMPVSILTDRQQAGALEYLLAGDRLAVMPSLIENSSLAVYEAVLCGIPFIASDSGGTAELIDARDREHVLCAPHPLPLAGALDAALTNGARVARPSFANASNLQQWIAFHQAHARGFGHGEELRETEVGAAAPNGAETLTVLVHGRSCGQPALSATMASLAAQRATIGDVIVGLDSPSADAASRLSTAVGRPVRCIDTSDCCPGLAFNLMAREATASHILCVSAGVALTDGTAQGLLNVARGACADVVVGAAALPSGQVDMPAVGHVGALMVDMGSAPLPLLLSRHALATLDGFSTADAPGHIQEIVARAHVQGLRCEVAAFIAATMDPVAMPPPGQRMQSALHASGPQLSSAPLALREPLMLATGLGVAATQRPQQPPIRRSPRRLGLLSPRRAPTQNQRATPPNLLTAARWSNLASRPPSSEPPGLSPPREPTRAETALRRQRWRAHRLGSDDTLTGALAFVYEQVAYGWVIDEAAPGLRIDVEAHRGDEVVARAVASGGHAILSRLRADVRAHTFAVDLSRLRAGRSGAPCRLQVARTEHRSVAVGVATPSGDLRAAALEGYCDRVADGMLIGWLWSPERPLDRRDVAVMVDGAVLGVTRASLYRGDLFEAGIGDGSYGFALPVPDTLRDGTPHRFDVLDAATGARLSRGRRRLVGDDLRKVFSFR